MKSLISLELRKQKKSFWGLISLIAICLAVASINLSIFSALDFDDGLLLTTVILQAFGLPFFALLLGSAAGAQLRSSECKAEEDIPVRANKRLLAAFIASLTYLILLASILFALSALLDYSSSIQQDFHVPFALVLLLPLFSAAFVFSYWLSQAVLGGAISAMIIGIPAYIFYPFLLFGGIDFMVVVFNAIPGLIAASIHLLSMFWLANRIERERRTSLPIKMGIAAVMMGALVVGIFGCFSVIPDIFDASRHNEFKQEDSTCNCKCS
jgi:hypothetical protein